MKILITGANGLVGKNLIEDIASTSNKVIATAPDTKKLKTFLNNNNLSNVEVEQLNVLDPQICDSIIKDVDIVVHLAAILYVPLSLEKPKKFIEVNYIGTLNVLEAMRKNKVNKIIFPSTQDIYGNNINSKEDNIKNISPLSIYSLSKLMCEDTIKIYSKIYGINYIIFRASHLYGKYQDKGLLPLLLNRVKKNDVVEIGDDVKRDFLNAKDFVDAIIMTMNHKKDDVFNIGSGTSTSIKEVINIIAQSLNKKVKIVTNEALFREPAIERWNELANASKLKKLGWKPQHNLKAWIKDNIHDIF